MNMLLWNSGLRRLQNGFESRGHTLFLPTPSPSGRKAPHPCMPWSSIPLKWRSLRPCMLSDGVWGKTPLPNDPDGYIACQKAANLSWTVKLDLCLQKVGVKQHSLSRSQKSGVSWLLDAVLPQSVLDHVIYEAIVGHLFVAFSAWKSCF